MKLLNVMLPVLCTVITGLSINVFADSNYGTVVPVQGQAFTSMLAPDWSPDGEWITFTASTAKPEVVHDNVILDSQVDIWIVSPKGGTPKNLTKASYGGDYREGFAWPNFSYDGSEVTYSKTLTQFTDAERNSEYTIESVNIETVSVRLLSRKTRTWVSGAMTGSIWSISI